MVAPSDNSPEKNSNASLDHTGEGIVIDIGTGDGRFVSAAARANPNKFYIGVDANAKALEKISTKVTRKPAKGGLPNVMFVQAAIEDLPEEFNTTADEIHIHFPWGSLLRAVALGDPNVLQSLRRIAAPRALLEIVIGVDPVRDRTEIERLGIPEVSPAYLKNELLPRYATAGFRIVENGTLDRSEWSRLDTSWARKLQGNDSRTVFYMVFETDD